MATLVERWARVYVALLRKGWKYVVILLWLAVIGFCGYRGIALFGNTEDEGGSLPASSLAYQAAAVLRTVPYGDLDTLALTIESPNMLSDEDLANLGIFFQGMQARMRNKDWIYNRIQFETFDTTYVHIPSRSGAWLQFDDPKEGFISEDGRGVLAAFRSSSWDPLIECLAFMRNQTKQYKDLLPQGATVRISGDGQIYEEILPALESDLLRGDGISIPLALLILCWAIHSARYIFVPIISILASVTIGLAGMLPISKRSAVPSAVPNIIMGVAIAMSVDYSLFMFSRFREEARAGSSVQSAVEKLLVTAGSTVLVSGVTFIGCCLSMLLIPLDLLSNMGVGAAISVAGSICFNLTFTPAIILIFPNYFKNATRKKGELSIQAGDYSLDVDGLEGEYDHLEDSDEEMLSVTERTSFMSDHSDDYNYEGVGDNGGDDDEFDAFHEHDDRPLLLSPSMGKHPDGLHQQGATPLLRSGFTDDSYSVSDRDVSIASGPRVTRGGRGNAHPMSPAQEAEFLNPDEHDAAEETAASNRRRKRAASKQASIAVRAARARQSAWYRFTGKVTRRPFVVICIVMLIAVAAGYPSLTFNHVGGITCTCPQNNALTKDFYGISRSFGGGYMFPYALIVHGRSKSELFTKAHTDKVNEVIRLFSAEMNHVKLKDFAGLTVANGKTLDFEEDINECLDECQTGVVNTPKCVRVCFYAEAYTTAQFFNATVTLVQPAVRPEEPQAQAWVRAARKNLRMLEEQFGTRMQLGLGDTLEYDSAEHLFHSFPVAIGTVFAIVVVLTLISFRSIAIAIKAGVSIGLTLSLVFGIGTCIYEYGVLKWMSWYSVRPIGGLCWIPFFISFSMMVGLGLDYHIFLLGRVIEFRRQGFSDRESIMLGVARTGRVITAAGIIMALAFFGLLFSQIVLVQQFALFVMVAVLLDTFVVRACLIPALMSVMGKYNWYPLKMPPVTRSAESMQAAALRRGPVSGRLVFNMSH